MHIIDASGKTDECGNADAVGGHSIVHDVSWIHAELQRWILDNLTAKWDSVVRKPEHLYDMFTGARALRSLITECTVHLLCLYGDTVHLIPVWAICLTTPSILAVVDP